MSAAAILAKAMAAGITLTANGDMLHYDGPAEAVANLLPELRQHKAELLGVLANRDRHGNLPTGRCSVCGCLSWWLDGSTWRCRRCTPPTSEQNAVCDSYVADPDDPPLAPPLAD